MFFRYAKAFINRYIITVYQNRKNQVNLNSEITMQTNSIGENTAVRTNI